MSWHARNNLALDYRSLPQVYQGLLKAYVGIATSLCAAILVLEALVLFLPALRRRFTDRVQVWIVFALVLVGVVAPAAMRTAGRLRTAPDRMILDSALQMELGAEKLADGRNPYRETYHGTALETWHRGNDAPSLYHFVYPPFGLVATTIARATSRTLFGVYDQRFLLLPCFMIAFALAARWMRGDPRRSWILALAFLNPWVADSVERGRLEGLIALLVVGMFELLRRRSWNGAAVLLACLVLTKTTFAPLVPFFFAYVWFRRGSFRVPVAVFAGVLAVLVVPFLVWDARAYVDDTWLSLSGRTAHPFPIDEAKYFGVGGVVLHFGWVDGPQSYFPFWIVQIPVCLALTVAGIAHLRRSPTVARMAAGFAVVACAFLYFSRFSDPTYWAALVSYALLALPVDNPTTA